MRIPVNFLLYMASVAMLGWAGFLFVEATFKAKPMDQDGGPSKAGFDVARAKIEEGRGLDRRETGWEYGNKKWWEQFREVNLTGKLPPPPTIEEPDKPEEPETPPEMPLQDIFQLISLMHHNVEAGAETHVVLRYREGLEVQVPESERPATAPAGGAPIANTVPPGQMPRPRGGRPQMSTPPIGNIQNMYVDHVKVGESLWPPFSDIVLVSVADDARSATFRRSGKEENDPPYYKSEMDLPQDVLAKLIEGQRRDRAGRTTENPTLRQTTSWLDVPETRQVTPGNFFISRDDNNLIREDPQELLNQVTLRPYRSTSGDRSRNGVQLLQVDQKLGRRFGVRSGDVILEVNGVPVTSRSQAIDVGTKQYKQGVREFKVRMMTMGRIEERTYTAPPDR